MEFDADYLKRYMRHTQFAEFGSEGQLRLAQSRALVVGVGGLGSWSSELLVRAGVGHIRICDNDRVDITNLHRTAQYVERDVAERRLKAEAAAARLRAIRSDCRIEAFAERVDFLTLPKAADGVDIILDGTDNFETRFLINDYAVKYNIPWVFAGVMEGQGQVAAMIPGKTPCLRCILPSVPSRGEPFGVLGPVVAFISALQAVEAVKILSGHANKANPCLMKIDLWNNSIQKIPLSKLWPTQPCPCCGRKEFEFLEPSNLT